jgi:hypothetical protein
MKIPNVQAAYVEPSKLTEYLLSTTHPVGRSKAVFLRTLGFADDSVGGLGQSLVAIAKTEEVVEAERSEYGMKYTIDGPMDTPGGRVVRVRTVWIIDHGEERPRFVTAYPLSEREP